MLVFTFFNGNGAMAMICAWWGIWHIVSGLACALWWRLAHRTAAQRRRAACAVAVAGMACAAVLVALLAGWVVPVQVPSAYRASFGV